MGICAVSSWRDAIMADVDVTIAVPLFNGEEFLEELLTAVFAQKTALKYEVLIIDSGSSDRSLDIIVQFPKIRLHQINNKEFGHGKTRNLAVGLAKGDFVVFLTQDAVPSHDQWLDYMIEPFSLNDKIGCVFGRQIPRPHCFVSLKREVDAVFKPLADAGSISIQRKDKLTTDLGITNNFLSDVNSAVRKSIHQKVPFQDLNYAEDQALGIDMLEAGYLKAYAPLGSVNHSHDYPLKKYYKRKFDEYIGLRKSTGYVAQVSARQLVTGTVRDTLLDYVYLIRDKDFTLTEKIHDFVLAPFYNLQLRRAIRMAANTHDEEAIKKHSLEASARSKAVR